MGTTIKKDDAREGCQMKIEDMQILPEFFGVKVAESIWVEGVEMKVGWGTLTSASLSRQEEGRVLVGCLTGQLKWSTEPPKSEMTADEKKILREIAAWFPSWQALHLEKDGDICIFADYGYCNCYFGFAEECSKAYRVLVPILEKYGDIHLEDYR